MVNFGKNLPLNDNFRENFRFPEKFSQNCLQKRNFWRKRKFSRKEISHKFDNFCLIFATLLEANTRQRRARATAATA
jgi:hypothetical protein